MKYLQNEEKDEYNDAYYVHYNIIVDKGQSPLRIDKFLMDRIQNTTRNKIQNAIKTDAVKVNEKVIKSNYKVKPEDVITVSFPEPPSTKEIIPENIPLDVVYKDDEILIINKKPGMVVHPAYNNWHGTLVNALAWHYNDLPTGKNGEIRPGLIHRIDKDTSGLMVIARTEYAMAHLARQFEKHNIERTYVSLVWGEPDPDEGTIDRNLGRSPKDRRVITTYKEPGEGKRAITHYKTIKSMNYVSLIQCNLETGRTHQIRAHLKSLGHPVFADEMYGGKQIKKGPAFSKYKAFVENCFKIMPRQALHAKTLGLIHPVTNQFMQFDSLLPEDFQLVLDKWDKYINSLKVKD